MRLICTPGRWAVGFLVGMAVAEAQTVSLRFLETDVSAQPGVPFKLSLYLDTLDSEVLAVNFYLRVSVEGSGYFHVVDRVWMSDKLTGVFKSDALVESASPTPASILAPRNGSLAVSGGYDLGGYTEDGGILGGTIGHHIADFWIGVDPSTPASQPGQPYIITTESNSGEGWVDGDFNDFAFSAHASVNVGVSVIPEPQDYMLAGAFGLLGTIAFRRFAQRKSARA